MDWDDIKVFLAIARAGSLGGAANSLGQTQPTMGRRLRAFEEKLGVALFQRSSEGFVLTDEGASVMSTAERMEQEALAFERTLEGGETELEGLLRVSASDWFGLHVLAPVFARFQEKHPRVSIDLITESRLLSLDAAKRTWYFASGRLRKAMWCSAGSPPFTTRCTARRSWKSRWRATGRARRSSP